VKCVVGYFGRLGAADQAEVARLYEGPADIDAAPDEDIPKLRAQALRVVELLETREGELAKVLNPKERLELSRCARHVTQAYELRASSSLTLRDALMAENARRIIEESYPGQKVMIWAHNDHVATWAPGSEKTMGAHLQDAFGDQLFVLGFAGEKGEVRARRIKGANYLEARRGQYVSLRLNPPVPFSAEALFAATGLDRFGLDLRHVPPNSELARWLSRSHLLRDLGWAYDPDDQTYGYNTLTDLAAAYNALVFIAESSAAKPLAD
jgi:erythromycin esterase